MSFFLFCELQSVILRQPNEIVGTDSVEPAELDEVLDLQLGASILNVAVALLGFVNDSAYFFLRQIPILPQIAHPDPVIHRIPPHGLISKVYHTHKLSIDIYSMIEYNINQPDKIIDFSPKLW